MRRRKAQCPAAGPPSAAQGHQEKARADVPQRAAEPVLGGEALPELGRVVQLVPLTRPFPSSGPVGRCGAYSRLGPSRRSSVHTGDMHGGVAPSGGGHCLCRRLHRRDQRPSSTARVRQEKATKELRLSQTPVTPSGGSGGSGADVMLDMCVCPYIPAACT